MSFISVWVKRDGLQYFIFEMCNGISDRTSVVKTLPGFITLSVP